MDLTEAEYIKKRWQEYTEELYKKDLHDPDNHNSVITTNKDTGSDGIPVQLFQILKDGAVKVLHSICQQIWKFSNGHKTGKGQFSSQSQRKLKLPHNCTHLIRYQSNA